MLGVNRRRLYNRGNSNLKLDHRSLILVVVSSVVTFRKREKKIPLQLFCFVCQSITSKQLLKGYFLKVFSNIFNILT